MLKITDPAKVKELWDLLRCSLCKRVFVEATTINVCVHTFCKDCIYRKFEKEGVKSCPVCKKILGSNPVEHLRPDENLRSIVNKITFGNTKKKASHEVPNQEGSSSKGEDNDDKSKEKAGKVLRTSSQESTSELPVAVNTKEAPLKMPEFSLNISEPKADGELKAPTKKKRNTIRKARQYNTVESKGKQKIENSVGIDGAAPENKAPLWFLLRPAEDKKGYGFPKLDKPSLCIRDYSTTISTFQKYLQQKLNLEDESEVEILCCGKKLNPTMKLDDIKKLWLECTLPKGAEKKKAKWKVEQLSIELAYRRCMV